MNEVIKEASIPSGWDTSRDGKKWEEYDTIKCPDGEVIDMQALLDEQDRAKASLTHLAPAFGGFISKLKFRYTFRIKTQATDGFNLLVNPQFTSHLDFTEKVFVMAHEVMHCLLNHIRRGKGDDPRRSNEAADYEVNITLADIDLFKMSTMQKIGAYIDKKYSGWGYEAIYKDITTSSSQSQSNAQQAKQAAGNAGGKGQDDGQGGGQQGQSGQGGGGGQQNKTYSADYKAGWAQAIEDYKAGKLKI